MYGTPTYKSWAEMKSRCNHSDQENKRFWRDVTYCERWKSFAAFFEDMGVRPEGTTLDRINPWGNYEPGNCRWADIYTQENNRRNNRKYEIGGELLTLSQIARKHNISRSNLANKIYLYGWDIEKAVGFLIRRKGE